MTLSTISSLVPKLKVFFADGPHPHRDWRTLLVISGVVLTATVVWHLHFFQTVVDGNNVGGTVLPTALPNAAEDPLAHVRALYEMRAREEAQYTSGTYEYRDPSL